MADNPAPSSSGDAKAVISDLLAELEEKAKASERAYARFRRRFEMLYYVLGVPATVFAAVASATAFAESVSNQVVGICAAIAAGLAGIQTLVRADRRARFNQTQQFVMSRIANDATSLRKITLNSIPAERAKAELDAVQERYISARDKSPE